MTDLQAPPPRWTLARLWRAFWRRTPPARLNELNQKVDRLTRLVERLLDAHKQDEKWRNTFRRQLNAILRNLYLSDADVAAPASLGGRRFRLRSQNEEDGIILALLKAGALRTRRFVEIGCGSTGGNAAVLAYEFGWTGLMVDASEKAIAEVRDLFRANPGVVAVRAKVSSDTFNDLLRQHGMTGEVDLLSIDVDSFDYWLLDALDPAVCSPRILLMEYNALFGPERTVTLPNGPKPKDAPKAYFGASLAAIEKVARRKGYRLVLCEEAGINAFFLRHDVAPAVPGLTPAQAYRPWVDKFDATGDRLKGLDVDEVVRERGLPLVEV